MRLEKYGPDTFHALDCDKASYQVWGGDGRSMISQIYGGILTFPSSGVRI